MGILTRGVFGGTMKKPVGERLAAVIEAVNGADSVEAAVFALRDLYELDNVTYHLAHTIGAQTDAPYVKSTYPAAWISRYVLRGYVMKDPVAVEGFRRMLPFDWRDVTMTEEAIAVMMDAQAHGLGGNGYSIPVIDKRGRRALLSLNSRMDGGEWTAFVRANLVDLVEAAQFLHRKAVHEIHGPEDPLPALSAREVECLTWYAQGKDYKAIAILLGISDHTAREYLKSARHKLGSSSLSQAVAKAIQLFLIKP